MKHDGFLSAEGILLEDVVVNGSLATISDSTFCVHLQRQYSALTELNEFMNLYHFGDQGPPQENSSTAKYLHALKVGYFRYTLSSTWLHIFTGGYVVL